MHSSVFSKMWNCAFNKMLHILSLYIKYIAFSINIPLAGFRRKLIVWTLSGLCLSHGRVQKKPSERSGEEWCLGRACRREDILYKFCCRNHVFLGFAHQHRRRRLSPKALESQYIFKLMSSSASSMCMAPLFHPAIVEMSSRHPLTHDTLKNNLLYSHMGSHGFYGGLQQNSSLRII